MDWNDTVAKAQKILGPKAEIPKPGSEVMKASDMWNKSAKAFQASADALEDSIVEFQDGISSLKNAMKLLATKIEKSDFGLDENNKDDQKKIDQAQKILIGGLDEEMDKCDSNIKLLDGLEKQVAAMQKFKASS